MEIKVLGPGCPRCQETERHVKEALAEKGIEVSVDHVTNPMEIAKYGIFGTPAVVIDGKVAQCCAQRGPDEATLLAAGLGQPLDY